MTTLRISRALYVFCGIFIIVGIFLLIPPTPYGAEINGTIDPGYYGYYPIDVLKAGGISGSFSEINSEPVRVYVLDSGQYDSFKASGNIATGMVLTGGSSGRFSTTFQVPGTYYLIIRHGLGLAQSSQSVTVYYNVDGLNLTFLSTGLAGLFVGVLAGVLGSRRTEAELIRIARAQTPGFFWQPPQARPNSPNAIGMPSQTITPVSSDSAALLSERLQRLENEIHRMDVMKRDQKLVNFQLFEKEYTEKLDQAASIRRRLESQESSVAA